MNNESQNEKTEEHYEHTSEGGSVTNNTDRNTQKARKKGG